MDFVTGPAMGVAKNNAARKGSARRAIRCIRRCDFRFR